MRADRLLSLVLLLQARPDAAAPELADRLGVSVRTVLRDVESLSAAGIPVYTERGRYGGIRLLDTYRTGLANLSRAEGAGLAVGQSRLAGDLGLGDALDSAIEKIIGAGGQAVRGGLAQGRRHVIVDVDPWMRAGEPVPLLPLIHDGLLRGRLLELDYRDSDGARRPLTVAPAGLVAKAGTWYLVTAAPSLVRVSRVLACTVLPQPAALPAGFDLEAAWAGLRDRVEVRPRDLRVVVTAAPDAAAMTRRLLARHLRDDDGVSSTVRLAFAGVPHAVGSLLGLGTRVEVTDPPEVRTALRAEALAVAALYDGA
ncbi:WYL domain-containing protein [Dactylosporangium aurantiacum]|uniref:WYL domain-containing protein n=1 Tax=Dactylosporangium aurantiacum TaxID=35754 RepID=A0A9Q9I8U4_9ACTN|nr:WYL domain-containing protein [Dactylosporangium aurantiacum]MDG6106454.1 WYL domain-containing protein [Dactylosporangium aurantiacum]UWZ50511.1 WYL domain-containing protein [Dactylosporangium aurantiacum]